MGRRSKPVPQQDATMNSIGARLRAARESKKMDLKDMAAALTYTDGYLSGIELGKHRVPEKLVHQYEVTLGLKKGELSDFVQASPKSRPIKGGRMWQVPPRYSFFTGRDDILEDMHRRLYSEKANSRVLAIVGLSGIGKTHLSVEYAYRYSNEYRTVLWLEVVSLDALVASCVELAKYFDLREKDSPDTSVIVKSVQHWLREEMPGSLIIFNNVEDLALLDGFLVQTDENHVIVTTRMQAIGPIAQKIILIEMDLKEATLLLLRRATIIPMDAPLSHVPETSLALAERISKIMAGLPIALDQAGSYLEETGCGLQEYLELLEAYQRKMFEQNVQSLSPYPLSVSTTWLVSFERIKATDFPASELLCLCAFLGSDKIYKELLIKGQSSVSFTLRATLADPFKFHHAISVLRRYSLVRTDEENGALFIHRLVQIALRDSLDADTQQLWVKYAISVVSQAFPMITATRDRSETWAKCQRYFPQATACIILIEQWQIKGEETAQLFRKVGRYLEERTQLNDAGEMYQCALELDRQSYGERHITIATDIGHLAILYEKQEKIKLAQKFYDQAYSICDQMGALGSLDPIVVRQYIRLLKRTGQNKKLGEMYLKEDVLHAEQQRTIKRIIINDDNEEEIKYQAKGNWSYEKRRGGRDINGDIHITHVEGASFTYSFTGIGIEIISDTLYAQGEIDIYVDKAYIQTTNISRILDKQTQTIIFSTTNLEFGFHELRVVVVREPFILDALVVVSYEEDIMGKDLPSDE